MRKKGFALITVLLVGTVLLVSAFMFMAQFRSEKEIVSTNALFKQCLNLAETGISKSLYDIRIADIFHQTGGDYFTWDKVQDLEALGVGQSLTLTEAADVSGGGTFRIKATVLEKDNVYNSEGKRKLRVRLTSLGTVYPANVSLNPFTSTSIYPLSRRVAEVQVNVVYYKKSATNEIPPKNDAVNYGIFSGANITFGGGAQETVGNIFANGNIDLGSSPSKVRVDGGEAIAHGTISGKGQATGGTISGAAEIPFPELNIAYYKDLAEKYFKEDCNDKWPYDGTKEGYTDTCTPAIRDAYKIALLGGVPTTLDAIKGRTDLSAVYYLEGDQIINGQFTTSGVIVINGNLRINGGSDIVNTGNLAILVSGDVEFANGTASVNGLMYAGGSFRGAGTFDIRGAIISKGSVDLKGTFDIEYDTNIGTYYNLSIEGSPGAIEKYDIDLAEEFPSTWKEVDYNSADW